MALANQWENGGALAFLGVLMLLGTGLAIPRLPETVGVANIAGLFFSGVPGAAALYAVYRARAESFPPEAIAAMTRRTVEGAVLVGGLIVILLLAAADPADRPLANMRAFTGLGMFIGLLVGSKEARAVERDQTAEAFRREREQLDFLNDILGHDVLNKATVIRGHAELLAERADDPDERAQLETIASEAREVGALAEDVRVLTESLGGGDLEPVGLSSVLDAEIETVRDSYDATIKTDIESDLQVRADDLLSSLFGNLLRNAVEHGLDRRLEDGGSTESEPDVFVEARETDDAVQVRVADRGPGIPDDDKEAVFDPEESGGVGLYIVRTLADRYDGEVRIEDADPTGAAFLVTLPALEA